MNSALIRLIARVGYVARGLVFISIGGLTLAAAIGLGGRKAGFQETVKSLLQDGVGGFVAFCLGAGLLCFSIWRLLEAVLPNDDRPRSLFQRAIFAGSGLFYLALSGWTLSNVFSARPPQGSSDQSAREWTAWLMGVPAGTALIGAIGLLLITGALVFSVRACNRHFKSAVALRSDAPAFISALGRYGLIARAVIYAEIGGFLIYAALSYRSREAKGFVGAFQTIEQFEYGDVILSVTAAGFIAFGVYEFGAAIYRDLVPQRVQSDP